MFVQPRHLEREERPAPRNLDRFNVANVSGRLIIDTGTIIESPRAPGMSVKYPQGLSCIALTTEE